MLSLVILALRADSPTQTMSNDALLDASLSKEFWNNHKRKNYQDAKSRNKDFAWKQDQARSQSQQLSRVSKGLEGRRGGCSLLKEAYEM